MNLRRAAVPLLLLLLAAPVHANDTAISLEGGAPTVIDAPGVRMVSERLTFSYVPAGTEAPGEDGLCRQGYEPWDGVCWFGESWRAELEYIFESVDVSGALTIGLPFVLPGEEAEANGPRGDQFVEDMRTYVDGNGAELTVIDDALRTDEWTAHRTFAVDVDFEPGQRRVLRHTYRGYASGTAGGESWFSYLLLSGRPWDGTIGHVEITFELPAFTPCVLVSVPHVLVGNTVRVALSDWEPDADFEVSWISAEAAALGDGVGVLEDDSALLCDELLRGRPPEEQARRLELLYGAPQTASDASLIEPPLQECAAMYAVSATLHDHIDRDTSWPPLWMQGAVHGLRYIEDPAYPSAMPEAVRACIDTWRMPSAPDGAAE